MSSCMPCHPHHITQPSVALLGTVLALLREARDKAPWCDAKVSARSLLTPADSPQRSL
jgi:hypothetical protein